MNESTDNTTTGTSSTNHRFKEGVDQKHMHDKQERRSQLWSDMQQVMADTESRDMSAEELSKYRAMEEDLDKLTKQIEVEERHEERSKTIGAPVRILEPQTETTEERSKNYEVAFDQWVRFGMSGLSNENRSNLLEGFVSPNEFRAQGVATGAAGGFSVPEGFRATITETLKAWGGMRRAGETITTESGSDLPWPTLDDTSNVGAILTENNQVSEQDITLGQKTLKAHMYTSKLVRVSLQLLQDNGVDLDSVLTRKLAERIGRIQNTHFTTGTGTGQPTGIQPTATVGKQGATATSVTYSELIDTLHSVDPAYRESGNCAWMMNDNSVAVIRKLLDSQNRPIWEPSLQVGAPDFLIGYPVVINQDMPSQASSARSILFGDFRRGYVIRDVLGVQMLRLEERYADFLQVGFLAFARSDGVVQDANAYKAFQNAA